MFETDDVSDTGAARRIRASTPSHRGGRVGRQASLSAGMRQAPLRAPNSSRLARAQPADEAGLRIPLTCETSVGWLGPLVRTVVVGPENWGLCFGGLTIHCDCVWPARLGVYEKPNSNGLGRAADRGTYLEATATRRPGADQLQTTAASKDGGSEEHGCGSRPCRDPYGDGVATAPRVTRR